MADDDMPAPTPRRRPVRRALWWIAALVGGLLLLIALAGTLLDSSAGRRFLTDQIERIAPESGLRIRVGRIEGSIYRQAVLRDVRLYDRQGLFLRAGEARLDWRPFDFLLRNRLTINDLTIPRAELLRLPDLKETADDQPILPDFDIRVGRLQVARLRLAPAVAGRAALVRLGGRADVRSGNADVRLDLSQVDGGDRARLTLIAAPDRGDFDMDADIVAARGGVIGGTLGLDRAVTGVVRGQGNWQRWRGALMADADGEALARLRLSATDGRYVATGRVWPALLAGGLPGRLSAGGVAVDVDGRFAERRFDGRFALVAAAVQIDGSGVVDLARNRFDNLRLNGWLRDPAALIGNAGGQNVRVAALVEGAMAGPRFDYRLSATYLAFGNVRLNGLNAVGQGVAGDAVARIPLNLRVASITGIGPLAEGIVRDLSAEGALLWRGDRLTADSIRVRSAGLNGDLTLSADMGRGGYQAAFTGALPGLEVQGLGRVDLTTSLTLRPASGGVSVTGTARAAMRRLDNGFLRTLTGGLPVVTSALSLGPDGILRFSDLRVTSPLLTLTGQGIRRRDGTFALSGRGVHRSYGPVIVTLDGRIDRPLVNLTLDRPLASAGVDGVTLRLVPTADGFDFTTEGQSLLGHFTANGVILLRPDGQTLIDVARLAVGGTVARGRLTVVSGGLAGRLDVAGGGLDGTVALALRGGIQAIEARLTARDAVFEGPPPILIRRGQLELVALLDPRGTDIRATFSGSGWRRGTLSIARLAGDVHLIDGRGTARLSIAGARGRDFALQLAASITPDRIRLRGEGRFAGRPLRLTRPAVVRRDGDGWRLEPAELSYGGGRSQLSGRFGGGAVELDAALDNLPLALIEIGWPRLGLGGLVSGRLTYRAGTTAPTGDAQLRISGLTRSGVTLTSQPVDIALNGALSETSAAVRAVVRSGGAVIGRVQGRTGPMQRSGDLIGRIVNAPLIGQLRYNGTADTLWRLTGIEAMALSGPVEVAADASGTLADPRIRGVMRARGARVENFQTGTVVTGVEAVGRFDGSRLQLRQIRGNTRGGGTITGGADFDLAAARGFGMDIRLEADNALLIERDDLVARVTGPLRIASDGAGGEISGALALNAGSFRLGRATAAEALPVINVREVNAPADRPATPRAAVPWRLNVTARGSSRFNVTGLGLDSDWSTDIAVRGDVSNFAILGTARLVRGDYMFAGRRFELQSGTIRFTGSTPVDPVLDIVAVDDISGIDATIRVRGTGLRPEITFASVPALPEDELLSRILFGSSITDISVAEAAQLGVALAGLRSGGGGLDPINAIRRSIGLDRLRILPANSEIGQGTSVAAGVNLSRRIYVEVITDGQGYSATRLEYQITRWLSLLASISTLGQQSINLRVQRDY